MLKEDCGQKRILEGCGTRIPGWMCGTVRMVVNPNYPRQKVVWLEHPENAPYAGGVTTELLRNIRFPTGESQVVDM